MLVKNADDPDPTGQWVEEKMNASAGHSDGTVGKALDVLDAVSAVGRPVRFSELLATGRWPKATLYRLLQTLANQGMLSYEQERGVYTLGLRLVRLAHRAWGQATIAPVSRPFLDALSARLGQTVHLAQLDHGQVLYVDKRNARNPIAMFSDTGKVGPAYCTGIGKAMLAHLPETELESAINSQSFYRHTPTTLTTAAALRTELADIRRTGMSFDREEHEAQIICVAVPILSTGEGALGALSVTSSTYRHTLDDLAALAPDLQATAAAIARELQPWAQQPGQTHHTGAE